MSQPKLTKRHKQIIAAIEEIGRACTPVDIRRVLKSSGLDLDPHSIKRLCRRLADEGLLEYFPGTINTLVLFGLPGWEIPPELDRAVDRQPVWVFGPRGTR